MKKQTTAATSTFGLEADLCEVLSARMPALLKGQKRVALLEEVQVGVVVPDLVLVRSAQSAAAASLSAFESWIVAELMAVSARRPETLAARLFAGHEKTVSALQRLERAGVVVRSSPRSYTLAKGWFPPGCEVIAVEAKLARWREAIQQAVTYLAFANRSYVALPAQTIERSVDVARACVASGVGLVAVSASHARILIKAPRRAMASPGWVWLVGRALSKTQSVDVDSSTARQLR